MTREELKQWAEAVAAKHIVGFVSDELTADILALLLDYEALAAGQQTERKSWARQIQAVEAKLAEVERERDNWRKTAEGVAISLDQFAKAWRTDGHALEAAESREKALTLRRDEDGEVWLQIRAASGNSASINLDFRRRGPVVHNVIEEIIAALAAGKAHED